MLTLLMWVLGLLGAAVLAGGVILVTVQANLYFGAALAAAAAGGTALGMAALQDRRERAIIGLRHCQDCGASVAEGAGFCPRCQSVRIQEPTSASTASARSAHTAREIPVSAYSPDGSGTIGWVDAAPPGMMGEGATGARTLRLWGIVLLGLAAVACVLGAVGGRT